MESHGMHKQAHEQEGSALMSDMKLIGEIKTRLSKSEYVMLPDAFTASLVTTWLESRWFVLRHYFV